MFSYPYLPFSLTKKRRFIFLILTVLFYALTTALTGMYIQLFMFIPLSIAVLTKLKYSKVQAVLATVGASTIGLIGEISNSIIKVFCVAQIQEKLTHFASRKMC